jgi:hypothetical protein
VSRVRYELGFYVREDGILDSHRRGNLTPVDAISPFAHLSTDALMCDRFP